MNGVIMESDQESGQKSLAFISDLYPAGHEWDIQLTIPVPVGWGEAHLSQIHVECLYNESSIAFHTQ